MKLPAAAVFFPPLLRLARRLRFPRLALLTLVATLALAGCGRQESFKSVDMTGNTSFGNDFSVTDTNGKIRTLADYKNKVVVLFFGYTHCPDVCPATLAELAQVMSRLGPDAARVQVLFVTVDPARDTPALLARYVAAFDPRFTGLRPADPAQLERVTKAFRVYHAKEAPTASGAYAVDHSAGSYVFGPDGRLRLFVRDGSGVDVWLHDIKVLLD